ncbi:MAG: TIGR03032 family protein [Saprospiraceae bacterium]|nr:TIGR03032 family protein [Saprospiraceae bacterium]
MSTAPPFSCSFSPQLPELLVRLKCSIAVSTYQAGKIVFISAKDAASLVQLPRTFNQAMGMAISGNKMAVATKDEVIVLVDSPDLARSYPKRPNQYDALYVPRLTYYTGQVDIHDLHWGDQGLWAVNTSFSCLALLTDEYSWIPKWQPPFIDKLASEDRCHLNGLAMRDGKPRYVTALGKGNTTQSWRRELTSGGVLMDVQTNKIILDKLSMPHSPIYHNGLIYFLESAKGRLLACSPDKKTFDVVKNLHGFTRGMALVEDYLFIGLSRLRQNSSTFSDLEMAKEATHAGIVVMHLPTRAIVGELKYHSSVEEIYDVQILKGRTRPGILNTVNPTHKSALSIPGATFWAQRSK